VSVSQVGYLGYAWATSIAVVTSDNLLIVAVGLGILVAVSTLLIRVGGVVENKARQVIREYQATGELPTTLERDTGELPTTLEREEIQRTLEVLNEKMDRLLEYG